MLFIYFFFAYPRSRPLADILFCHRFSRKKKPSLNLFIGNLILPFTWKQREYVEWESEKNTAFAKANKIEIKKKKRVPYKRLVHIDFWMSLKSAERTEYYTRNAYWNTVMKSIDAYAWKEVSGMMVRDTDVVEDTRWWFQHTQRIHNTHEHKHTTIAQRSEMRWVRRQWWWMGEE